MGRFAAFCPLMVGFGSVCELDLVFNFYKVYQILDEMVVGGEVMETSKLIVNRSLKNTDYYD